MSAHTRLLWRFPVSRLVAVLALVAPLAAVVGAITDAGASASTSAEASAVTWALRQVGQTEYHGVLWAGLCLPFVQDAYEKGTSPLMPPISSIAHPVGGWRGYPNPTDPQDVWAGTFSAGTRGTGPNPPYGSLVFFDAKPGHDPEDFSHVEIMGPNAEMIGTPGEPGQVVFRETLAHHEGAGDYNTYVGWWLPDGTSATVQVLPYAAGSAEGDLRAVSCAGSNFCMAVGQSGFAKQPQARLLAEVYQGGTWAVSPVKYPMDAESAILQGVSCPSPRFCVAVGYGLLPPHPSATLETLIEVFNGSTWSIIAAPDAKSGVGMELFGVSCPSTTFCAAVGSGAYAEMYHAKKRCNNGAKSGHSCWAVAPMGTDPDGAMYGVSCTSKTFCVAVGNIGQTQEPISAVFKGTWLPVAVPRASSKWRNTLPAVSCTSSSYCLAVGTVAGPDGRMPQFTETYDGSHWSPRLLPKDLPGEVAAVACKAPEDCAVVGYNDGPDGRSRSTQPMVEEGIGGAFAFVPGVASQGYLFELVGVSGSDSGWVAVGRFTSGCCASNPAVVTWAR